MSTYGIIVAYGGVKMKKIPIGVEDFKEIIEENYYYVDKTRFIEEVINEGAKVELFTRPRRFGKTLNASMLKYFFDIEKAEENRKLFKNLYIENSSVIEKQGKYPVIFISMKDIKSKSFEECLEDIKNVIYSIFNEFSYVREKLNQAEQVVFDNAWLMKGNVSQLKFSLKNLSMFLNKYYNQKVILLIDEYDTPLISAYEYGYYNQAVDFFKSLYGAVLKTNSSLEMGIMTGIIRVVRAGIFSDLNNLKVNTLLSESYDDSFGLSENEVERILNDYGMEYNIKEVKKWYNGYKFGAINVYNPWSIINFISNKKLGAYWIDTSENYLIKDILKVADEETFTKLNLLLTGEKIKEEITGKSNLKDILDVHDIWELLLFSGYLTIDKEISTDIYSIKIPNNEVKVFFRDSFIKIAFGGKKTLNKLLKNLLNNQIEEFEKNLQEIMIKYMSFNDVSTLEKVYHCFILGLVINLEEEYKVKSNLESGFGRYDILIEPLNRSKRAFILEFKISDTEKNLEKNAKEGIKQIKDKKYYFALKDKGIKEITLMGMAFHKKLVKIKSEDI